LLDEFELGRLGTLFDSMSAHKNKLSRCAQDVITNRANRVTNGR
jgi:hypothetical protein